MVYWNHLLLLRLCKHKSFFKNSQTLQGIGVNVVTHFKVLIYHPKKLIFDTLIWDLFHRGPRNILRLAVFSDPNQLIISDIYTDLFAQFLSPFIENIGAVDRCISFFKILNHLLCSCFKLCHFLEHNFLNLKSRFLSLSVKFKVIHIILIY